MSRAEATELANVLANQYGPQQAAALRGDGFAHAAAERWMQINASGNWGLIIPALRAYAAGQDQPATHTQLDGIGRVPLPLPGTHQTDEHGRPMTYWGGKENAAVQVVAMATSGTDTAILRDEPAAAPLPEEVHRLIDELALTDGAAKHMEEVARLSMHCARLQDAHPCCGEYSTCTRACTPRGRFLAVPEGCVVVPLGWIKSIRNDLAAICPNPGDDSPDFDTCLGRENSADSACLTRAYLLIREIYEDATKEKPHG